MTKTRKETLEFASELTGTFAEEMRAEAEACEQELKDMVATIEDLENAIRENHPKADDNEVTIMTVIELADMAGQVAESLAKRDRLDAAMALVKFATMIGLAFDGWKPAHEEEGEDNE